MFFNEFRFLKIHNSGLLRLIQNFDPTYILIRLNFKLILPLIEFLNQHIAFRIINKLTQIRIIFIHQLNMFLFQFFHHLIIVRIRVSEMLLQVSYHDIFVDHFVHLFKYFSSMGALEAFAHGALEFNY